MEAGAEVVNMGGCDLCPVEPRRDIRTLSPRRLLEDYVLVMHREGRHKARNKAPMFESVLGVAASSADVLWRALLDAAAAADEAEARGDTGFGNMYVLRVPLSTAKRSGTVLSVWIVRHGEDFPRLATCNIV